MDVSELYKGIMSGDRRCLAKAISAVEDQDPASEGLISKVFSKTGKAHIIGVTGPPGAGKSTLVDRVAKEYRSRGKTVGIIAVDPTSPFTGGAILGDRIRMNELSTDKGVFIRSMGTRGQLGGLARATSDVIHLLDAFGKDIILVETVGAGQSEVDIVQNAYTVIIVQMPGMGDDIQAIKAGIFEIGDIIVVNKADREGCEKTMSELQAMLELGDQGQSGWKVPILRAIARDGDGIKETVEAVERHWTYLNENGLLDLLRKENLRHRFTHVLKEKFVQCALDESTGPGKELIGQVERGELDPYTAAGKVISRFKGKEA
jgi:LAO/AO transport system kinase